MVEKRARSLIIFEAYIQSQKTREQYLFLLTKFCEYYKIKSVDSILSLNKTKLKEKIEDYVLQFKDKGKSVSYIRVITFAIQSFCEANDVEGINFKKIRRLLGKKQRPKKTRPFTTEEIKLLLGVSKELRSKAVILFLSASGVRRGGLIDLKIGDLKEMSDDCLAVTVYANTDEEYTTFINKECKEHLTRYFEKRKKDGETLADNHPVFRSGYSFGSAKPKPISKESLTDIVKRAKKNSGINFNDTTNILLHAFRRRFNTILKLQSNANISCIERLMGHSVTIPLDNSYFQPDLGTLFEEYKKGIADLTIDDKTRILEEMRVLESENSRLEQLEKRYAEDTLKEKEFQRMKEEIIKELSDPNSDPNAEYDRIITKGKKRPTFEEMHKESQKRKTMSLKEYLNDRQHTKN